MERECRNGYPADAYGHLGGGPDCPLRIIQLVPARPGTRAVFEVDGRLVVGLEVELWALVESCTGYTFVRGMEPEGNGFINDRKGFCQWLPGEVLDANSN